MKKQSASELEKKIIPIAPLMLSKPSSPEMTDMGLNRARIFSNAISLSMMLDTVRIIGWHDANGEYIFRQPDSERENMIFVTLSGGGILELNGLSYRIRPSTITVIPDNVEVSYYTDPAEKHWEFYWAHIRGANTSNVLRHLYQNHNYLLPLRNPDVFVSIFEDILTSPLEGSAMILYNSRKVSDLLHLFVEEIVCNQNSIPDNNDFVKTILRYIEEHYAQSITLADLASLLFMSEENLIRMFKKHTGYTPHAYLKMYRIMVACNLLRNTDLPVKRIAGMVGYKTVSFFTSEFRTLKGVTPTVFRSEIPQHMSSSSDEE